MAPIAMQYGPSLGFLGLREAIADRMNKMYMPMGMEKVEAKNIMVVTGSQQGRHRRRVFLNKDDVVLCESHDLPRRYRRFQFRTAKIHRSPDR